MEVGGVGFRVEVPEPDSGEGDEGEVDRVGVGPVLHVGQVAREGQDDGKTESCGYELLHLLRLFILQAVGQSKFLHNPSDEVGSVLRVNG